jgi:hypothetical protein
MRKFVLLNCTARSWEYVADMLEIRPTPYNGIIGHPTCIELEYDSTDTINCTIFHSMSLKENAAVRNLGASLTNIKSTKKEQEGTNYVNSLSFKLVGTLKKKININEFFEKLKKQSYSSSGVKKLNEIITNGDDQQQNIILNASKYNNLVAANLNKEDVLIVDYADAAIYSLKFPVATLNIISPKFGMFTQDINSKEVKFSSVYNYHYDLGLELQKLAKAEPEIIQLYENAGFNANDIITKIKKAQAANNAAVTILKAYRSY